MIYFTFASAFFTLIVAVSTVGRLINGFLKGTFPAMYGEIILLLIGLGVTFIFYKMYIKEKYNIEEFSLKKIEFENDYENKKEELSQKEESVNKFYAEREESANKFYAERIDEANSKYDEMIKKAQKEYDEKIFAANSVIDDYNNELIKIEEKAKRKAARLDANIDMLQQNIEKLNSEYTYEISKFTIEDNITSEEYKSKYNMSVLREKELVKNNKALNANYSDSKHSIKEIRNDERQLLRCFNSETAAVLTSITIKNIDTSKNKIIRAFETLNKLFETDKVSISPKMLEMKLEQADLMYAYQYQKEQERLQQKAIREQMVEEEKVRREIEKEKAKIEKEETQFKNEVSKLMGYMQKANEAEKQLYIDKIKELEAKLKKVEADKENVLQREQNTRAGYVYVISNIGSFGDDVYKIGMTRRLEPMDRVKELGDASVPFEFDVHAMIFSDDAPALETILHNTFKANQVNKVNPRKEFFKVKLEEIEKVVKDNYNATVTFTKIAEAAQYRESLRLAEVVMA